MTMAARQINDAGFQLITSFESLSLSAYLCPSGVPTIGYGHTNGVKMGMVITVDQANQFLDQDLCDAEATVSESVTVALTDNQYAALVSFVFNCGDEAFKTSTLLALLNRGWYEQVPAQLMRWVHDHTGAVDQGLIRRREAECDLWKLK